MNNQKIKKVNGKFSLLNYFKIIFFGVKDDEYWEKDGVNLYREPDDPVVKSYVYPKLDIIIKQ